MVVEDPQIPEPDYSPIIIRKISSKHHQQPKMKKEIQRKSNLDLWGNAARYKGSLEELDQESPDESQSSGNNSRVKDLAEKLKHQSERDQRRRQQRIEKKGTYSLSALTLLFIVTLRLIQRVFRLRKFEANSRI